MKNGARNLAAVNRPNNVALRLLGLTCKKNVNEFRTLS